MLLCRLASVARSRRHGSTPASRGVKARRTASSQIQSVRVSPEPRKTSCRVDCASASHADHGAMLLSHLSETERLYVIFLCRVGCALSTSVASRDVKARRTACVRASKKVQRASPSTSIPSKSRIAHRRRAQAIVMRGRRETTHRITARIRLHSPIKPKHRACRRDIFLPSPSSIAMAKLLP